MLKIYKTVDKRLDEQFPIQLDINDLLTISQGTMDIHKKQSDILKSIENYIGEVIYLDGLILRITKPHSYAITAYKSIDDVAKLPDHVRYILNDIDESTSNAIYQFNPIIVNAEAFKNAFIDNTTNDNIRDLELYYKQLEVVYPHTIDDDALHVGFNALFNHLTTEHIAECLCDDESTLSLIYEYKGKFFTSDFNPIPRPFSIKFKHRDIEGRDELFNDIEVNYPNLYKNIVSWIEHNTITTTITFKPEESVVKTFNDRYRLSIPLINNTVNRKLRAVGTANDMSTKIAFNMMDIYVKSKDTTVHKKSYERFIIEKHYPLLSKYLTK